MIPASRTLKNGRNDYVFNIGATASRPVSPRRPGAHHGPSRVLTATRRCFRMVDVAPPPVARSARAPWAELDAWGLAALMLGAALLAYGPALRGGFLWDDDAHVTAPALRSLHGLWRIWTEVGATQQYYPALHSAFWIEHRLWGDAVVGYHLANVALHAAAATLLVRGLRRIGFAAPVLAGLLFLLHPVCVESVAWISEQKNTLSAVLYLSAALVYLRFDKSRARAPYLIAFGLFALALLTKSVTATLPAALLVVLWWARGRLGWRRDVAPLVPWLLAGAASGIFTAWAEARLIGAEGADFALTAPQRVLLAGRALAFYLSKLVWPAHLAFIYPRWSLDPGDARQVLCGAGALAALAGAAALARRHRGPLAGMLFFAGTLFPALGFLNVYPFLFSFVADHFQYLASLGILVPAAWGLERAAARAGLGAGWRAWLLLALPAALGVLTWRQCREYRDAEGLYRATLARNPSAWLAHYNLAVSLGSRPGRLEEAIAEYDATLRLKPDHWAARNNLASALLRAPGRTADAIAQYEAAVRLRPDFAEAHNNLGVALGRDPGRLQEAIAHLQIALRLRPDYDGAHNNLGALLLRQPGSRAEAIAQFEAAIRLEPSNAEYHYNLANALAGSPGRLPEAVAQYREALRLRPDYMEAHSNLGAALGHLPGRAAEAVAECEAAVRLAPRSAAAHVNLANALARVPGRTPEALAQYAEAVAANPGDPETHKDFGVLLADQPGRAADAVAEFETAIRLEPDFAQAHYCLGLVLLREPGRRQEAAAHLRRALEIRPDLEAARTVLERLEPGGR